MSRFPPLLELKSKLTFVEIFTVLKYNKRNFSYSSCLCEEVKQFSLCVWPFAGLMYGLRVADSSEEKGVRG